MKRYVVIALVSLVVMVALSPLRAVSFCWSSWVGFLVYFFMFLFWAKVKVFKQPLVLSRILIAMLVGYWVLQLHIRIIDFDSTLISLPDVLLVSLSMVLAYLSCRFFQKKLYVTFFVSVLFASLVSFKGYDMYLHKLNYDTFTGQMQEKCPLPLDFVTNKSDNFTLSPGKGYALLYCWNEYCGYCISSMPKVQTLYDQKRDDVSVYALYCPPELTGFSERALELVKGYTFPVLIELSEQVYFKPTCFPTVYLIDLSSKKVVFKGDLDFAVKLLDEL